MKSYIICHISYIIYIYVIYHIYISIFIIYIYIYIPKMVHQTWVFLPSNFSERSTLAFSFKVGMDFAGETMDSVDLGPRSQQLDGTHGKAVPASYGMLIGC